MAKTSNDGNQDRLPGGAWNEQGRRQIQVRIVAGRPEFETVLRQLTEGRVVRPAIAWTGGGRAGPDPESPPRPQARRYVRRLPVPSEAGSKIRYLKVEDIDWISAEGQYLRLYAQNTTVLVRGPAMTMGNLTARLDPERFMRVHRSHIVNVERVVGLRTDAPAKRYVLLASGSEVPVSQAHWEQLQATLIGCDWG